MPIKVSQGMSTLGTQRFLKSNTVINNSAKRMENRSKVDPIIDDTVNLKVSTEPHSKNRILSILVENRNAAESTIPDTANPKEIAVLTKNYVLKNYSPNMERQTNS